MTMTESEQQQVHDEAVAARAERIAAARAAFPDVATTADAVTVARAAFHDAVKAAAASASLRQIAAAASVSPEQVRRILDGRAK